jgi:hypothetical protein
LFVASGLDVVSWVGRKEVEITVAIRHKVYSDEAPTRSGRDFGSLWSSMISYSSLHARSPISSLPGTELVGFRPGHATMEEGGYDRVRSVLWLDVWALVALDPADHSEQRLG